MTANQRSMPEKATVHSREAALSADRVMEAALVSVSLSDYSGLFGLPPAFTPPSPPASVVRLVEWPWIQPLAVILRISGWSIDDVVSSPKVAAEVRWLWKLWNVSQRTSRERETQNRIAEERWWRQQGLRIPCFLCGTTDGCECDSRAGSHFPARSTVS